MDRGRVGTLAIGNKAMRENIIKHQQSVHKERVNKIKNRKPGTSNTLDNTAPVIVKAALNNPRKNALRQEFNDVTERENRYFCHCCALVVAVLFLFLLFAN